MTQLNILISLHSGYGVGDGAQMSAVLRHLRKHRPDWVIDYRADEGKHQAGYDIVSDHFAFGTSHPSGCSRHYDGEVEICLFDTWANWHDRPNTRVSSCLHEVFGLPWDESCGRYEINVPWQTMEQGERLMPSIPGRYVALHYRGDSSPARKDLSHEQATAICAGIRAAGGCPLLLDWRGQWPLHEEKVLPGVHGRDVSVNAAVISQCAAYVGIDSGPSKCASATSTPALVIWTGHHPAPFHDPAPNTTHLVPEGYHGLFPVCNDPGVIQWFEAHHAVRTYRDDPVAEACAWLREVLQ